jgi:hypothetical protein
METRTRTTHKIEPSKGSPDNGPMTGFILFESTFTETRRSNRENWLMDTTQAMTREAVATFTRASLQEHIADAVDALAWLGD